MADTASDNVASRSDALPVASGSDADRLLDDYVEADSFDAVPYNGGDGSFSNTVDRSGIQLVLQFYDMSGRSLEVANTFNSSTGKASIGRPSNYVSTLGIAFRLYKRSLPASSGTYWLRMRYSSDVGGYNLKMGNLNLVKSIHNSTQVVSGGNTGVFSPDGAGGFYYGAYVDISSSVSYMQLNLPSDAVPPIGGHISVNFTPYNGEAQLSPPDVPGQDANSSMSDGIAQQVEQGDTIIELIKNTIQTISSQLTAFWNQLAGEFTNLYNKMNQQHSEQLEADRQNTDQVTGAIEEHGNFIIEGLKSLFIPSNDYFKQWFDDMYVFFNDRLGFLMLPVDLLKRFADMYMSAGSGSSGIPFPEFRWVDGTVIIPAQTVGFDFLETDWGKEVQDMLYFLGNVIMIGALLNLMHRKFEEVLRN